MRLRLALLVGAAAGAVAATQPIADTDLFWHLATARETLAHGFVHTDVFSWTVRGAPVSIDQWLGQLVFYAGYLALDWRGIAVVRVVAVVALLTLVTLNATQGRSVRPLAAVAAAIPAFLLTHALWVDRPELLGLVCFVALLVLLRAGRGASGYQGRDAALVAVPLLILVWANVHGSFALGAVLTLAVSVEGALRDRARARAYVLVAATALGATLLTPSGIGAWTAPGSHFLSPPRDIQEWALIDLRTPLGLAYGATLALLVACALRGPRVDVRDLVILIPVTFLSLTAARQAPLLAIVAAPLFAQRAAALIDDLERRARRRGMTETLSTRGTPSLGRDGDPPRAGALGHAAALLPALGLIAAAVLIAPVAVDERAYPVNALTSIPSGDGTLARYEWGGWLIWRAPSAPVFVDGRLTPYAGAILDDYRRIVAAAPGWREALAKRGVRTLLLTPTDPAAARAGELGWRVLASSETFVLFAVP
jgi:hypothetical protein